MLHALAELGEVLAKVSFRGMLAKVSGYSCKN
jgi:hypothetical protein